MYKNYTKTIGMPRRHIKNVWLIMRLTTILLIATFLQVSATGLAQKITLSKRQASLKTVLKELKAQSGYTFVSTESLYKKSKPVNITVDNEDFQEVLNKIFEDQPLSFTVYKKTVTIKEKEQALVNDLINQIKLIDISGKVSDEQGNPLPGATVTVKGENMSTTTDAKGGFTLRKIKEDAVLQISFIGFMTKEVSANADLSNIRLEQSNSKLDEIQVIAYGTTSQRLNTGNVSTVKAADIEKQPVSNPLLALEGRVPSLQITQNTGLPGSGITVRIQGRNSLRKGNEPFYVIDGVPFLSVLLPSINSGLMGNGNAAVVDGTTAGGGNPLNFINPSDIESIDVLKDADATAIYGSRAANGAIIITTKKGKAGQTKVDFDFQQGIGQVARKIKMLTTEDYLQLRKEAYTNDGLAFPTAATAPDVTNYDITNYDKNKNTDWQKELIGGHSKYSNIQAAVSGGDNLTTFRINGAYNRETTVFPGDFGSIKGSFGFNINHSSTNQRLKIQFSGSYLVNDNNLSLVDLTQSALTIAPNAPALKNQDGSINWQPIGNNQITAFLNPLHFLNAIFNVKTNNLIGNGLISYRLLPGLVLKMNLGYTNLSQIELQKTPLTYYAPEQRADNNRIAAYNTSNIQSWIVEPQINYTRGFGQHTINLLLGTTFQKNASNTLQTSGSGFLSDGVMDDIRSAPIATILNNYITNYNYTAVFGRLNYDWNDTYLLNLTFRRDGSSRFGSENQFHNFGAIGGALIFTNYESIKKALPFLSFGKIRGSFGMTGNDQIGDYQFLSLYQTPTGVSTAYQGVAGLLAKGHSNAFLQWEETQKLQAGLDLGLFHDRLLIDVGGYYNRSSNQLLNYALPALTGFPSIIGNLPATVQNSGLEISLNTVNIQKKTFNWSSSLNITIPKNKLLKFDGIETSSYKDIFVIGMPIDLIKTYSYAGVDPATGNYQFNKADGTITVTPGDADKIFTYSPSPQLYGGIKNTFSYKTFSLDILFDFVKQTGVNMFGQYRFVGAFIGGTGSSTTAGGTPAFYEDRWKQPGDVATFGKATTSYFLPGNVSAVSSSLAVSDASYIKLRNVSLSYALPDKFVKFIQAKDLRIFLQGRNLWTITKYKGLDPENQSINSLPPLRIITLGLHVTF
jgi:TonB-dependent starch-binding outer membrane protein SusC